MCCVRRCRQSLILDLQAIVSEPLALGCSELAHGGPCRGPRRTSGPTARGARPDRLTASAVADALRRPVVAPDRLALARLDGEMRKVALSMVQSNDPAALRRLEDLRVERSRIEATGTDEDQPSAKVALSYLSSLGLLWRETSDEGRRAIVRATFARLGALGGRIVSVEVTPAAERRGLALALPAILNAVTGVGGTGLEPVTSSV